MKSIINKETLHKKIPVVNWCRKISFITFIAVMIVGGLGANLIHAFYFGLIFFLMQLFLIYVWGGKISLPLYFKIYVGFLFLCILTFFWSKDINMSYQIMVLLISGALAWLFFYNISKDHVHEFSCDLFDWFEKSIVILGIVFGILTIAARLVGLYFTSHGLSLFLQGTMNHHHIGDLMVIVLLYVIYRLKKEKKNILFWSLGVWSIGFIIFSQSRSAVVSLLAGLLFLALKYGWFKKVGKYKMPLYFLGALLFILFASQKTLIFSRDYYFQALTSLYYNPLGTGLGTFAQISVDPKYHILGMSGFAKFVHNFILEMFVGVGVFAFVFLAWLIKAISYALDAEGGKHILASSIFLALTVNFMFDYTYFLPALFWLWFASLGLLQAKSSS